MSQITLLFLTQVNLYLMSYANKIMLHPFNYKFPKKISKSLQFNPIFLALLVQPTVQSSPQINPTVELLNLPSQNASFMSFSAQREMIHHSWKRKAFSSPLNYREQIPLICQISPSFEKARRKNASAIVPVMLVVTAQMKLPQLTRHSFGQIMWK